MSHWMEQASLIDTHQRSAAPEPLPDGPEPRAAVIAPAVTVTGGIYGSGPVLVEGTVTGEIKVRGDVTVIKDGAVRGPIQADTVTVSGSVEGDVAARTRLQLEMTGSIQGDVTTCSFTIADGSYFNGRSHMTKPGEEPTFLY